MSILKIAVINPEKADGLARTILDGLHTLSLSKEVDFRLSTAFSYDLRLNERVLVRKDFIDFASTADCIFLINCKYGVDIALATAIDRWNKTIFLDGSELGKNRRYDNAIQKMVLGGTFEGSGKINKEMFEKASLYFRREKPYLDTIIPLPFGIENKYISYQQGKTKKDIDFFCVFGQEEYPPLRKLARERLEDFCVKNGFSFHTSKTSSSEEFYALLARSKVAISVGGGGYDTMRFWEILGNNCILLTETIDIYHPDGDALKYDRIHPFINLYDLEYQLNKMGHFLRNGYDEKKVIFEYEQILKKHSSVARVREVLQRARDKKLIA